MYIYLTTQVYIRGFVARLGYASNTGTIPSPKLTSRI